ncbi:hypothetical protein AOXY_G17019 [Acipenser oxyrinchus oxyrinchus]|uniref:Uncharacterized protein n=1 Tax=Acipenser oxyrinchus oxyrinchus TaxID=40147 RepID=A0AAD8G0U6_ACIOX|nr:hypothetical protein AOXY_G17019 [Acipenser oxyrinchus oxyrinchus]
MSRAGFTEGLATWHRQVEIRSKERATGQSDTMSSVGTTDYRLSAGDGRYPGGTQRPAEVQKLLGEFQELYQDRIRRLDQSGDGREETLKLKIGVLQSYVRDLSEQNQVLIQTLEELETGSEQRVNSLERELEEYACRLKENDQENRTLRSTHESLEQDNYVSSDLENGGRGSCVRPSLALRPLPTEHLTGTTATIHGTP